MLLDRSVPQHLILSFLNKLDSKSFSRAYRSCRFLRDSVEDNKRRLQITNHCTLCVAITKDPLNCISVKILTANGVVYWSTECSDELLITIIIPSLAFLKLQTFCPCLNDKKMSGIVSAFVRHRMFFTKAVVAPDFSEISRLIKYLKVTELEMKGSMRQMSFVNTDRLKEDLRHLNTVKLDCTTNSTSYRLLSDVVPNCRHVELKLFGTLDQYLTGIAGCIERILNGSSSERSGRISVFQGGLPGNIGVDDISEHFGFVSFELIAPDMLSFPFEQNHLVIGWKSEETALRRLLCMTFHYAIIKNQKQFSQLLKLLKGEKPRINTAKC